MMPSGDIIVTGGQNADKTSIYHLADGSWNAVANMHISRGYGSSCLLSDGKVWTVMFGLHSAIDHTVQLLEHMCRFRKENGSAGVCVGWVMEWSKGLEQGCRAV
jgi:hypothetical protein